MQLAGRLRGAPGMDLCPNAEARAGWGTRTPYRKVTMKRTLILLLTLLLVLGGSTSSVVAKDKDNGKDDAKAAAELCKKDGWKSLTDEDGQPFKNQGQCNKYAKQGGKLIQADDGTDASARTAATATATPTATATAASTEATQVPSLEIVDGTKPWDGYLEGEGFTPGETLTKVTFTSDRETLNLTSPVGTVINADGTFTTERIIYWCSEFDGYGETTGTVTVEDSSGKTYSQTFDMAMHCMPKP